MSGAPAGPPGPIDVCHISFGGLGGQGVVVRTLAEQFAAQGLRNAVILHAPADDLDDDPANWPQFAQVEVVPRTGKLDLAALAAVAGIIRRMRPRAVICHTHESVPAAFVGQLLGRRHPQLVLVEHQSMALRRRLEDVRSLIALPFCRAVVVFTDAYARQYPFRRLPLPAVKRLTVVPNGVDTDRYAPRRDHPAATGPAPAFVIGRACRLIAIKDVDTLIDAMALLSARPDTASARLVIAGEGPTRADLEAQTARLGLTDRVEFLGQLDEGSILDFYASLDAYALATLGESVSVALLEAYACGLPVVASDVDGVGELVHDEVDGLLVAPQDAPAFAAALTRLITDAALGARLGAAARTRVESDYSARAMATGYLDLLRRLGAI